MLTNLLIPPTHRCATCGAFWRQWGPRELPAGDPNWATGAWSAMTKCAACCAKTIDPTKTEELRTIRITTQTGYVFETYDQDNHLVSEIDTTHPAPQYMRDAVYADGSHMYQPSMQVPDESGLFPPGTRSIQVERQELEPDRPGHKLGE